MTAPQQLDLFGEPPAAECEMLTMSNLHSESPDNADQMQMFAPAERVAELAGRFEEDDPEELADFW